MFPYFILGLALLIGFVLLGRWFVSADPKKIATGLKWTLIVLGVVVVIYLFVVGRAYIATFLLPALLVFLLRSRGLWQRIKAARGPSPGQTSEVNTAFLKMTLDHDSGEMDGLVLAGQFQGAALSQLELEHLVALWQECRAQDTQSAAVLEAYLDRVHGDTWREAAGAEPSGDSAGAGGGPRAAANGQMTREEAYEILGLEPGATNEEINAAHHRLMRKIHPDHGGSNYLAAKINQAKDLLLGG